MHAAFIIEGSRTDNNITNNLDKQSNKKKGECLAFKFFINISSQIHLFLSSVLGKGKKKEEKKQEKKQQPKKEPVKKEPEPAEELDEAEAILAAEPKGKDPFDSMPKG